ncbi:uncharacterized protein MELLADRAFT_103065 [Melampsora larici-populina 98AG31]|uniref:Uncharacterized protein n=1 Tax=Melampsora larici-populina (strain 98AG31 / pathotype 3-4-7) TaxID=747676 RepID=F4RAF3_MELLP|nr:uncharacterized protein MELLADRAFT_103065 [Melampsora larici-populina 98AG31]EGG10471.1 hypothetical protein MELLADRAFT_103065 [Melampsora larici-populina 98AG31]
MSPRRRVDFLQWHSTTAARPNQSKTNSYVSSSIKYVEGERAHPKSDCAAQLNRQDPSTCVASSFEATVKSSRPSIFPFALEDPMLPPSRLVLIKSGAWTLLSCHNPTKCLPIGSPNAVPLTLRPRFEPAPFGRARCIWLTGEVYARPELRDTMVRVRPGFAIEQDDYASQLPVPLPVITVRSRGYVLRFGRQNLDRWIVVALHNVSDESSGRVIHFNVIYEVSTEVVAEIGEDVFGLGNVVNFHGQVMHYFRRSGKWVVKQGMRMARHGLLVHVQLPYPTWLVLYQINQGVLAHSHG